MTSRPLIVTLPIKNAKTTFPVYYVDYLCVDTVERKSGIAPQIIQTHVYNERRMNKNIQISLFKRESELTNIIPLTQYSTYKLSLVNIPYEKLPLASIKLIEITKRTISLLLEFIFEQKEKFQCIIVPDLGNIISLIESNNIIIYGLLENQKLCSCYIFKNSMVHYNDGKAIDFIGSITNVCFLEIFYIGFCNSIHELCRRQNANQIIFEMISDNVLIYNKYLNIMNNKFVSPTAYYFYNYRLKPIDSDKVFIIC